MPQLNPIAISDASGDSHTFTPVDIQGGVASLEVNSGVPIANPRLTVSSTKTAQGKRKLTLKLAMPVVQDAVLGGVTRKTVVRTAYADLTMTFDQTSETAERTHVRNMLIAILGDASIASANDGLSAFY